MQFPVRWIFWTFALVNAGSAGIMAAIVGDNQIAGQYGAMCAAAAVCLVFAVNAVSCAALALDK